LHHADSGTSGLVLILASNAARSYAVICRTRTLSSMCSRTGSGRAVQL